MFYTGLGLLGWFCCVDIGLDPPFFFYWSYLYIFLPWSSGLMLFGLPSTTISRGGFNLSSFLYCILPVILLTQLFAKSCEAQLNSQFYFLSDLLKEIFNTYFSLITFYILSNSTDAFNLGRAYAT